MYVRQFRECLDWCGEDAGTISLQEHSQIDGTVSMRSFLGRGAFLFCLATSSGRARSTPIKIDVVDDMVDGHVTVNFMKPAVTFNFYFHDELSRRTWYLCEVHTNNPAKLAKDSIYLSPWPSEAGQDLGACGLQLPLP